METKAKTQSNKTTVTDQKLQNDLLNCEDEITKHLSQTIALVDLIRTAQDVDVDYATLANIAWGLADRLRDIKMTHSELTENYRELINRK